MSPHTNGKEQAPVILKTSVEKNPTSLGVGREGKKMAARTQHEGKTERAKESHDRCSQPPGMRMPKTADLGTQALLVVNSFKLHLNAFIYQTRGVFHVIYQTREGVFHLTSKHYKSYIKHKHKTE